MVKKILFTFLILSMVIGITGCDVKFIERVDPDKDLGNVEEKDPNLGEVPETTVIPATPTPAPTPKKNIQTISGIVFEMRDDILQVFLAENSITYKTPEDNAEKEEELLKGEPLNLMGQSEDKKWYMVKHFEGPVCYVEASKVSMSYVKPDTTVILEPTPLPPTAEPTPATISTPVPTKKPKPTPAPTKKPKKTPKPSVADDPDPNVKPDTPSKPSGGNKPGKKPKPTKKPQKNPGYKTKGIPFPKNPEATSVNLGITFADVDMILRVTYDNTKANSGPGKATTSTGYFEKQTFMRGDTVSCTGIGQNGYCRVELPNNEIGFILGIYLEEVK